MHTLLLADEPSGQLLGTAALIVERKFIHNCGKVSCRSTCCDSSCYVTARTKGVAPACLCVALLLPDMAGRGCAACTIAQVVLHIIVVGVVLLRWAI